MVLTTESIPCAAAAIPADMPAAAIVGLPEVEHHSTKQRHDGRGRFVRGDRTRNALRRRTRTTTIPRRNQEEDEVAALVAVLNAEKNAKEVVLFVIKDFNDELLGITTHSTPPVSIDLGGSCCEDRCGVGVFYCSYGIRFL
jgi:hypothetical protein